MNMLVTNPSISTCVSTAITELDDQTQGGQGQVRFMEGAEWDALAEQFDDAIHEQSHCFNAARWGKNNVENIAIFHNAQLIGGASVILLTPPIIRTGIAIVKWGPLWRKRGELPNPDRLEMILACLKSEYADKRKLYLTIMPPADPEYGMHFAGSLIRLGFDKGTSLPAPERYLIDVPLEENELRRSLSQKWRYNLKKAERHNFQFSITDDMKSFKAFTELYDTMLKRKQFNDSSAICTLEKLINSKIKAFRPKIVLMNYEGRLIAGAVIDLSGDRAVYLYGATDDRALKLNAGYALHWHIVSYLRNYTSIRQYDLGGNDLDRGLHQFKKGFVGKRGAICQTPPNYHFGSTVISKVFGRAVFTLNDVMRTIRRKLNP